MSLRFLSLTARGYVQPLTTEHCCSVHYNYDRGQQVAHSGGPHAESIILNRGRSVAMWTFTGRVFPLNGHPPSNMLLL